MKTLAVVISGKQGSGKSALAKNLGKQFDKMEGYVTLEHRFAQPLYEMHDAIWKIMNSYGVQRTTVKDGRLLQLLGTEWGRETISQDIWIDLAKNKFEEFQNRPQPMKKGLVLGDNKGVFIIEDCRFKNEVTAFPGALVVRLEADTETRKARCSQWREIPHKSELDLDDYKFNNVLDAAKLSEEEVLVRVYNDVMYCLSDGIR